MTYWIEGIVIVIASIVWIVYYLGGIKKINAFAMNELKQATEGYVKALIDEDDLSKAVSKFTNGMVSPDVSRLMLVQSAIFWSSMMVAILGKMIRIDTIAWFGIVGLVVALAMMGLALLISFALSQVWLPSYDENK